MTSTPSCQPSRMWQCWKMIATCSSTSGLDFVSHACLLSPHQLTCIAGVDVSAAQSSGQRFKTSVVFSVMEGPGQLFKALSVFALRDLDMTKIESRPMRSNPVQLANGAGARSPPAHAALFPVYYRLCACPFDVAPIRTQSLSIINMALGFQQ